MTTTVKIEAHCASTKEVAISIEDGNALQQIVLQDGENREVYAYDARRITVYEREKAIQIDADPAQT